MKILIGFLVFNAFLSAHLFSNNLKLKQEVRELENIVREGRLHIYNLGDNNERVQKLFSA